MSEIAPPPVYSHEAPLDADLNTDNAASQDPEPQILIIPTIDAINFQKGFLGSEEERAAIEGELQVKGAQPDAWARVTVCLRTLEAVYDEEIELGSSEVELYPGASSLSQLPSSFLFSILLMPDTPQSIRTTRSSLKHILTACLYPSDPCKPTLTKSLDVHTKRYSSHTLSIPNAPETHYLDDPVPIQAEVPRTTFFAGEGIPIYVSVPPPRQDVVDRGLRLRNVRAELVRVIRFKKAESTSDTLTDTESVESDWDMEPDPAREGPSSASTTVLEPPPQAKALSSPSSSGASHRTVISHSGAQCRFHSTRPVRLRFVLNRMSPTSSPTEFSTELPSEHGLPHDDAESASITQSTLLHSVTFCLYVHVAFVSVSSRTENISTTKIPLTLLPPPAPLPEVAPSMEAAYQKKHDRPPVKTNRWEEGEAIVPVYSEGQAGPSALPSGAPPPFEEREAPPPFWNHYSEASTSSRLPTFLESESEIILPPEAPASMSQPGPNRPAVVGEGIDFGFPAEQQFDGHSVDLQRSTTPPPTLEEASMDVTVTQMVEFTESEHSIQGLEIVLDHRDAQRDEPPPPPPPAMDDPSDPPPSIDSDFRMPVSSPRQQSHTSPPRAATPRMRSPSPTPPPREVRDAHGHDPPPYLVPESHTEHEQVNRPPPYVD